MNWELDGNWDLACQRQMFYMRVVAPLAASLAASPADGGGNNVLFGGRINKLGLGSELALPAAVAAVAVPGKAHNSSFYLWDFGMACQSCVCDAAATLTPGCSTPPSSSVYASVHPPAWAFVTLSIPTLINGFVFSSSPFLPPHIRSLTHTLSHALLSFSFADDASWPCLRVLNVGAVTVTVTANVTPKSSSS